MDAYVNSWFHGTVVEKCCCNVLPVDFLSVDLSNYILIHTLSVEQHSFLYCSFSVPTAEGNVIRHGPYRAYVRTSPQYIPGHGIRKYKTALKNLIPIRKKARSV